MRAALLLVCAPLVLVAGCRGDVQGVRLDLTKVATIARAYRSARAAARTPPEVRELSPEQLNDVGVMLERRGMLERAEEHYRLAVERKPDFARAWVNLGNVLRQRRCDDDAIECYRRALQQDPASFEAVNNFADLCADTGRFLNEALNLLRPALEKHPPEESVGRDTLGKLWLRLGSPAHAAEAFQAAVTMADPRDKALRAAILHRLAQAYRSMGREDRARSADMRAALMEP